jgi:hypothetical protein
MTLGAWSTWHSSKVSQGLGTKPSNGFDDRLGQNDLRSRRFCRNMVWTMFRQTVHSLVMLAWTWLGTKLAPFK